MLNVTIMRSAWQDISGSLVIRLSMGTANVCCMEMAIAKTSVIECMFRVINLPGTSRNERVRVQVAQEGDSLSATRSS